MAFLPSLLFNYVFLFSKTMVLRGWEFGIMGDLKTILRFKLARGRAEKQVEMSKIEEKPTKCKRAASTESKIFFFEEL
jgi:hypothetical protein